MDKKVTDIKSRGKNMLLQTFLENITLLDALALIAWLRGTEEGMCYRQASKLLDARKEAAERAKQ